MFYLEHLPAVLGTSLVVVACTGTVDQGEPDVTPTDDGELGLSLEREDDELDDADADADADLDTGALSRENADAEFAESDDQAAASDAYRRRCDRRNAWRCREGHRGWRWVRIPYDDYGRRCCVRVRPPHHWW